MSRTAGAVGSLLVHAALVAAMVWPPALYLKGSAPVKPKRVGDEVEMRPIPSSDGSGEGMGCERTYRGIGVVMSFSGTVSEVVAGGPADVAGLRAGDRFLNEEEFFRDKYAVGRVLSLRIERDGLPLVLPVRIGRVCFTEGQQP